MDWVVVGLLVAALAALFFAERWLHRHMQGVALLLTGDPELAVWFYVLPLLPGIALHELSHALVARLLGAQVGPISITPRRIDGHIQLGFVPVERLDPLRASLIGLAPLLLGIGVILASGWAVGGRHVDAALAAGDWAGVASGLWAVFGARDAWLWAYLIFAVGNTMLPSRSDRQAWPAMIAFLVLLGIVIWVSGMGAALAGGAAIFLTTVLRGLLTLCLLVLVFDVPFVALVWGAEKLLERVRGVRLTY